MGSKSHKSILSLAINEKDLKLSVGLVRVVVNNCLAWIIPIPASRWGHFLRELKNYKTGSSLRAKQKKSLLASTVEAWDRGGGPRAGKTMNSQGVLVSSPEA